MKFNKWTLGLAALGVVSLASAAKAEEKQNFLQTALSSTTISGYVDTSLEWQVEPTGQPADLGPVSIPFRGASKTDGFNLNVIKLSIEKPLDESEWAAGYKVDLLFGPDAVGYNTSANALGGQANGLTGVTASSDFSIKQAYVSLRVPVGNGLEFKVGTFDTIVGYEVFESGNNPNFTRSWGYAVEPTEHTGVLASYRVNDIISLSAGVANTLVAGINARDTETSQSTVGVTEDSFWNKTWMGSVALTAPTSWGWAAGSSLYGGIVYGFGDSTQSGLGSPFVAGNSFPQPHSTADQANYYAGLTLNTPIASLKGGIAYDRVVNLGGVQSNDADIVGIYASFQATEKLSLNGRAEFGWWSTDASTPGNFNSTSLTGTVQYDLWQNVVSRVEVRWDQFTYNTPGIPTTDAIGVYANIIYKF